MVYHVEVCASRYEIKGKLEIQELKIEGSNP